MMKYVRWLLASPGILMAAVGIYWISLVVLLIGSQSARNEFREFSKALERYSESRKGA